MEFFLLGLEGGWGEQMLHSPDAPFSPWGASGSPLAAGQGFRSHHLDVVFTPLRTDCGVKSGDLYCSQNKH